MKLASVMLSIGAAALLSYGNPAQAQIIPFNSPTQLIDNDANQGSPTIVLFGGDLYLYYVNHSNNTIFVDVNITGNPQSTGIVVNSAELTDVGAAVINGTMLISYVGTNNNLEFATSTNGVNFNGGFTPSNQELGLGNVGPNTAFIPALTSNGTTVYVATVGTNGMVYMSSTTDGGTFTPLNGEGISVSSDATVSRPSLTIFNGNPWVAFTTNGVGRNAVVGNAVNGSVIPVQTNVSWGNSNRSGNFAGVALFAFDGDLFVYGQDTASSQQLKSIVSSDGNNWSLSTNTGNQMRWTPSLAISSSNTAYLVYQDDGNTNISFRHN
jgi:hypothetical protein